MKLGYLAAITDMLLSGTATAGAATRTFVSGGGADGGTCTRAAPRLSFAFAQQQTDSGGEINCVDAGNFGSIAITKSLTIDCAGTMGGVTPGGVEAIVIDTPGVVAKLRHLSINGAGNSLNGIRFSNGDALFIENCVIANFNGGAGGQGNGIMFAPSGVPAELYVLDSVISGNGHASDGAGVLIQPAGSGSARAVVERTRIENNTHGILANGAGSTGVISTQIRDSVVAGSKFNGVTSSSGAGASTTSLTMERSSSLLNGAAGIQAQGAGAYVILADSTVMSNVLGLSASGGGDIFSYQNNQLSGNATDGAVSMALGLK